MSTATFAWYTANDTVTANTAQVTASTAAGNLKISKDNSAWATTITFDAPAAPTAPMMPTAADLSTFATAIKASRLKALANGKGEEIQAQIIGEEYRNNGTNTCKLKYMWEAPNGKIKEGKTKDAYTSAEAQLIKDRGSIKVLYYKGESVVLDLPELTKEQKAERILARNGAFKCPYCGTIMKANDRECPSCGAKR